jgi:hypothetical protein
MDSKHIPRPEADLAEFLMARSRHELKRHPRSPVVCTPQAAKDIDLSGIFRMTAQEAEDACANWGAAA